MSGDWIRIQKTCVPHHLCSHLVALEKGVSRSLLIIYDTDYSPWTIRVQERKNLIRALSWLTLTKLSTNNAQMCSLYEYKCCSQYFWHFRSLGKCQWISTVWGRASSEEALLKWQVFPFPLLKGQTKSLLLQIDLTFNGQVRICGYRWNQVRVWGWLRLTQVPLFI